MCDVLPGEHGPSCCKVKHIPDVKVIYVQFVKSCDLVMDDLQDETSLMMMKMTIYQQDY